MYRAYTVLSWILLFQLTYRGTATAPATATATVTVTATATATTAWILLFRLAYRVDRMYQVGTIELILLFRLAYRVATVRRTISSTVPSLASGYSTTTIDGEWLLLFRSAY
jgi:hypothetical protein